MKLYDLKTLHMEQPVIDKTPCFSWKICSSRPNVIQEKYRIIVKRGEDFLWDTGEVFSREQSFIEYKGSPLSSETRYQWTVTVWDSHGQSASAKAVFETAFFVRQTGRQNGSSAHLRERMHVDKISETVIRRFFLKRSSCLKNG